MALLGYLAIGLLLASILLEFDCGESIFMLTVLLWPVELAVFLMIGVAAIPIVIGQKIGKIIKKML